VISLKHPVTGHEISVDKESTDFWKAAGYRESAASASPRKATTRKSARSTKKSDSK
jgi:hypothetical protein